MFSLGGLTCTQTASVEGYDSEMFKHQRLTRTYFLCLVP